LASIKDYPSFAPKCVREINLIVPLIRKGKAIINI